MRTESDLSHGNLATLVEEVAQMEEKIQAEEAQVNTAVMLTEIGKEKKSRQELQGELDEVKRLVSKMNRQAEDRSQLDIHTKETKDLQNKIQFLKRKHAEELEHLLGEMPEDNIKNKLETCLVNLRKCIADCRVSLSSLNKRKTQLDTTIKSHRAQADRKEEEIKGDTGRAVMVVPHQHRGHRQDSDGFCLTSTGDTGRTVMVVPHQHRGHRQDSDGCASPAQGTQAGRDGCASPAQGTQAGP
ncbi:hypothetical protein GWK47_009287 [Chionoecetes opilio]|uniref:Uncharacterized protein n=1 Tax=Chionoecetes opilio TaxID=41210 RepID=A0A8J4XXR6_CHIOP|nr:hypothetical protein GWK47_009287 [Chionoecetes opilio]